jgi:hypothetical protein
VTAHELLRRGPVPALDTSHQLDVVGLAHASSVPVSSLSVPAARSV